MPSSVSSIPSNSSKSGFGKELLTTSIGWLTSSRYRTNLIGSAPKVRQNRFKHHDFGESEGESMKCRNESPYYHQAFDLHFAV
jgi:hypothetical protein